MRRKIAVWLLSCCALTFLIVISGGATRLTHSGLSIVEWKPITGTLPPLNARQWNEEFSKYQGSPEYLKTNLGMSLKQFKSIFWLEYFHRLLGRCAALFFILPLAYFTLGRQLEKDILPRLIGIAGLWGLQGALGWFMVSSGLVDDPHVSHYRLTAHLSVAGLLYTAMLWTAMDLLRPREESPWSGAGQVKLLAGAVAALSFLVIMSGGLVAGLGAGFSFNTFPLMAGHWVPPFLFELSPLLLNFFDNLVTVQFDHRVLALLLSSAVFALWALGLASGPPPRVRRALHILGAAMTAQLTLGILTLLYRVPVALGVAHQAGAFVLLTGALLTLHELTHQRPKILS